MRPALDDHGRGPHQTANWELSRPSCGPAKSAEPIQCPTGEISGLEACGSAHWWARKIKSLGHEVVLLHAKFIRPFVQTNKTDAADARAIWTAVQQPGMRTVAAKTEDQQAMLGSIRVE